MRCLIFGFYNKLNLGDQFFVEAYRELLPNHALTFTDKITEELFSSNDCVFLGGGSFLDGQPNMSREMLEKLPSKPIIYLGVGAETSIHPWHKYLLERASLVYIRSELHLDKIRALNKNVYICPDLVYSLSDKIITSKQKDKSILFIPNAHVVSKWNDAAWKQTHWESFKSEMSQVFEQLISSEYKIDVLSMCENTRHNDSFSAVEILNKMCNGKLTILPYKEHNFIDLSKIISSYTLTISQRYHGLILSDLCNVPCINIHHHDKLKQFSSNLTSNIDYYGVNKSAILSEINNIFLRKLNLLDDKISIYKNIFEQLKDKVNNIIEG